MAGRPTHREEVEVEEEENEVEEEESEEVEEEEKDGRQKWRTLEHNGPLLAPPYEPLPKSVCLLYDGKELRLSQDAEEIATFYAKMLDNDYTTNEVFNNNFFYDWRKAMTEEEREKITELKKCNFTKIANWFKKNAKERKEKELKEKKEALARGYGICTMNGLDEEIANGVTPPGLFCGRGEHPLKGKVRRRIQPKDITINIGEEAKVPEPPPGHKWKEVLHDHRVTWLAKWTDNVRDRPKYVRPSPVSLTRCNADRQKFETARKLNNYIEQIRKSYSDDFENPDPIQQQRAAATYFIDKLALRAGNEKGNDEADTVGCCSLRVKHIKLKEELNGLYVVVLDFLGKDSIRYYKEMPVEKSVYECLRLFTENKEPGDKLFDRLTTKILNDHLKELTDQLDQLEGLTARVFRTFNASRLMQEKLNQFTKEGMTNDQKISAFMKANTEVAILCNHKRKVPGVEKYENALHTSLAYYIDPRIVVAWCKKWGVPFEKIYIKGLLAKFHWAIDMNQPDFVF